MDNPKQCQLCDAPITDCFIDGKIYGSTSWAYMCPTCHKSQGIGLGTGLGQRYELKDSKWVKTEG